LNIIVIYCIIIHNILQILFELVCGKVNIKTLNNESKPVHLLGCFFFKIPSWF